MFAKWHQHLPAEVEVWGVQLPGREDRLLVPPAGHIDHILRVIGPDAIELGRDSQLVLVGNCLGALVVYELTRWLRDQGAGGPVLLAVGAAPPPRFLGPHWDPPIHQLPDDDVLRVVGGSAGIDKELLDDPEMRELLVPGFRADAQVEETYEHRPGDLFSCPILAMAGRDDPDAPEDLLREWAKETGDDLTVRLFPGGHLFMVTEYPGVIAAIRELLVTG
jgi:medium-chain acyl-[acyl-carrier-protein] hydrolase